MLLKSLLRLILESEASDQAHAMGLRYKGHGYWMDKSGNVVAQTIDGKLVKTGDNAQDATSVSDKGQETPPTSTVKPQSDIAPASDSDEKYFKAMTKKYNPPTDTTVDKPLTHKEIMHQKVDIGIKKGLNEGGTYKGTDGKVRYVKFYKNDSIAHCEKLCDVFYQELGIKAPTAVTFDYNGQTAFASEILDGVSHELYDDPNNKKQGSQVVEIDYHVADEILGGFVADCFMANWDVVGVNEGYMRNILIMKDGSVARIDQGGALLFGGAGGPKPQSALNKLDEWTFFPTQNPSYKTVFKSMSIESPDELPNTMLGQISAIFQLESKYGGWGNFVEMHVPGMNPQDKSKLILMLNTRTQLLDDKRVHLEELAGYHGHQDDEDGQ